MEGDSDTLVSTQRLTLCVFPPLHSPVPLPSPPSAPSHPFSLPNSLPIPYCPFPLPSFPLPSLLLSLPFPLTSSIPPHFQIRRLTSPPHLSMRHSPTLQIGVTIPLPSLSVSLPRVFITSMRLPSCPVPLVPSPPLPALSFRPFPPFLPVPSSLSVRTFLSLSARPFLSLS